MLANLAFGPSACARVVPVSPATAPMPVPEEGWFEDGIASWYGVPFHGRQTAAGETYDMEAMTAAHKTLPFGTVLWVQNLDNGLSTTVRINDRGPFVRGRNLDLSRRAAMELNMMGPGTARVRLTFVDTSARMAQASCWMVQTRAYSDLEDAELVGRSLERDGHTVEVTTGPQGLYSLRAGPFQSRMEAQGLTRRMGGALFGCGASDG